MSSKRILMIGWEYPPAITGGLGIACQGIARALATRGHQVMFLVPHLPPGVKDDSIELFDVRSLMGLFSTEELEFLNDFESLMEPDRKSPIYSAYASSDYIPPPATDEFGEPLLFEGGYGRRLYTEIHKYAEFAGKLARKIQFDVIHLHDWMTFPAGLAAMNASGKPMISHVHATEFDRSGEHINQFVFDLERITFEKSNAIITVSNYTKNILVDRYSIPEEKIYPIHNAVEFELPDSMIHENTVKTREKIVLFLGRMTFQKGPDYFVRAARAVIEAVPDVRFVMVGTGDMYHRMIELAADLGIGRYFHYTGFLNRDQVQKIYGMSSLYVMPSVSEPFGISSLEAMLHGVPVIVSKQSGVSEVISNCLKVDFWDIEDLSRSMIQVLTDPELSKSMSDNGFHEAISITWDDTASLIEKVYDTCS